MSLNVLELTKELVACPSVTPNDADCQTILSKHLKALGFQIEHLAFGEVQNLWARRGTQGPLFVFAGHTDVVPPGPLPQWTSPPFQPEVRDGFLYGRGVADMKGNIAAMLVACEKFITQHPEHHGSIGWLITSDEEGPSIDGTAKVVEYLKNKKEKIDYCIVGEPSSEQKLGDTLKIGRRGTLSGTLVIHGKQGHIAYPHLADNPIHNALPAFAELTHIEWDKGDQFFPATSLQISNIHAGTGAGNVIPGALEIQFNFRYSPAVTAQQLQDKVVAILQQHKLKFDIVWHHSGQPFLTPEGNFAKLCSAAIQEITGVTPVLSTAGGTSDGRFIATLGCQLIEMGLGNRTIHQIDERVAVNDLEKLVQIYQRVLEKIFSD